MNKNSISLLMLISLLYVNKVRADIFYSPDNIPASISATYTGMFNMKSIAEDLADLLSKATGSKLKSQPYTGNEKGILLLLDPSFTRTSNEAGTVEYTKDGQIIFRARYATGISYAVYSWLLNLGFRFSLPGAVWATIPSLNYLRLKKQKLEYSPKFRLRTIYASGGMSTVKGLDESNSNQNEWWLWYRRNRMGCDYIKIDGHIGELFNILHKPQIEKDTLILAPVNGKRQYDVSGKIDPTHKEGVDLFADWIVTEYGKEQSVWPSTLPRKKYFSVDPGDGLNYCHTIECQQQFHSVSDQVFSIANTVAKKIRLADDRAGVSTMAYTERADTPSIKLEPNIHVMVVPSAFQAVTSPAELMLRWRKKTANISQYDFLNIGVWAFDQPFFNLSRYTGWLQFLNRLHIEGMSFEASMSKFASGFQQYCILQFLNSPYQSVDNVLNNFCRINFQEAASPVIKLFRKWYFSDVHLHTNQDKGAFDPDELSECIEWIHQAEITPGINPTVEQRIFQLKAYMVYICNFYELYYSPEFKNKINRQAKAEAVLDYTWKLYNLNILHNSQLNDLLKTETANPATWEMKSSNRFAAYNRSFDNEIRTDFEKCRSAYPFSNEIKKLPESFFIANQQFGADSIFISSMDEDAFGHFNYPLSFYNTKPSVLTVLVKQTLSNKKTIAQSAVVSCESEDYNFIESTYLYPGDTTTKIIFRIPKKGFYRLNLSYYDANLASFILVPDKQLFFINKKKLLMNGLLLQPEQKNLQDKGNAIAFYNTTGRLELSFPYISNINPVKLFTANKKSIKTEMKNNKIYADCPVHQFIYYTNEVYRWPPAIVNNPPYFFFLKK